MSFVVRDQLEHFIHTTTKEINVVKIAYDDGIIRRMMTKKKQQAASFEYCIILLYDYFAIYDDDEALTAQNINSKIHFEYM